MINASYSYHKRFDRHLVGCLLIYHNSYLRVREKC